MTQKTGTSKYPIVVPGVGPKPCAFMIVGEAPGREEIASGEPFVGRSGEYLSESLGRVGLDRSDVYITNVFKGDVGSGNRNPTPQEIAAHGESLRSEITEVNPAGILLLGAVATRAFIPEVKRMGDVVGKRIQVDGRHVYPVWHPAFILRGNTGAGSEFDYAVARWFLTSEVLYAHQGQWKTNAVLYGDGTGRYGRQDQLESSS